MSISHSYKEFKDDRFDPQPVDPFAGDPGVRQEGERDRKAAALAEATAPEADELTPAEEIVFERMDNQGRMSDGEIRKEIIAMRPQTTGVEAVKRFVDVADVPSFKSAPPIHDAQPDGTLFGAELLDPEGEVEKRASMLQDIHEQSDMDYADRQIKRGLSPDHVNALLKVRQERRDARFS